MVDFKAFQLMRNANIQTVVKAKHDSLGGFICNDERNL